MSELNTAATEIKQHIPLDPFELADEAIRELTIASNAGDTIDQAKVMDLRSRLGQLSIQRAEAALQMNDLGIQH